MQQSPHMAPTMPSFQTANITTEQIQKYLEENKKLILAIMDNQNLGKINECAQYQALLQKNLMYLAAIADAQPNTPTMASPINPHPSMHQGAFFMQHHPQVVSPIPAHPAAMFQQRFVNPNQMMDPLQQQQQQQQQQVIHGQMMGVGMRPSSGAINNGFHAVHLEAAAAMGRNPSPADIHGMGGKLDPPEVLGGRPDGPSSSPSDQLDSEPSYLKRSEDPK